MSRKAIVMSGMVLGSFVGGYIPILLGASFLSFFSLLGNTIGGLVGIYIAYKITAGY